jgi:hypothetical protein
VPKPVDEGGKCQEHERRSGGQLQAKEEVLHWPRINERSLAMPTAKKEECR